MLDGANALRIMFTSGRKIDEPLQISAQAGDDFFMHADALGSPISHTDDTGQLAERAHISAYGETRFKSILDDSAARSGTGNPFGFTGREIDETGFMNFRARQTYDPLVGRFLQQDPLGTAAGVNVYQYVKSRPTRFSDPSGLVSGDPGEDLYYSDTPAYSPDVPDAYAAGDFAAGFGDTVSSGFGIAWYFGYPSMTEAIRNQWTSMGYGDSVSGCSGNYRLGQASALAWLISFNAIGFAQGYEFVLFNRNLRIAPWGNRTGHRIGRWPHYHRRPGIGKHRPWERGF